ncbi:Bug family tripartite tricarboxylate transporter substrate binding protein [Pseudorhodoferax sp.]|uniref:Bug family tripartite tricarboxylate transporter substrate binding protein n=1 Tax=Pseudorhodoferax sp. TaxID=1993553 RepID=UPI002DD618AA|nr:tripartite tricarboxylate transporter substrate-binding protein [Pseudorhodoferax sp.]
MTGRRTLLQGAGAFIGAAAFPALRAQPAAFPGRPLSLTVAFAPGGAGDIVARRIAKEMGSFLGQPVVVENKPAPMVGVQTVARSKPDGHTMMMVGNGTTITSALFEKLPYDLVKDFAHVSTMSFFDVALVVDAASRLASVADVIAQARANPGGMNIATVRLGSTQHMTASMFMAMTGIQATLIPFKATADVLSALRSRDVQLAFEIVPPILSQIAAQTVRPLATASTTRSPKLPQVPTLQEAGIAGFDIASWNGISVPAATPRPVVERLAQAVQAAVANPEVQRELLNLGAQARSSTPAEMTQRVQGEIAKWNGVIDKTGIERQKGF